MRVREASSASRTSCCCATAPTLAGRTAIGRARIWWSKSSARTTRTRIGTWWRRAGGLRRDGHWESTGCRGPARRDADGAGAAVGRHTSSTAGPGVGETAGFGAARRFGGGGVGGCSMPRRRALERRELRRDAVAGEGDGSRVGFLLSSVCWTCPQPAMTDLGGTGHDGVQGQCLVPGRAATIR